MEFGVAVDRAGEEARVSVSGELDMFTSSSLRRELADLIADGARDITVDLANVEFVDSTALGVLVGAFKRLRALDGDLTLANPSQGTKNVLDITGINRILDVVSDRDDVGVDRRSPDARSAAGPDQATSA